MAKMIFALKNNRIVNIDSVKTGLECDCECIACGAKLIAKNAGVVREHHFAHYNCDETSNCYSKSIVFGVSDIVKRNSRILLPQLNKQFGNETKEIFGIGTFFEYYTAEIIERNEVGNSGCYSLLLLTDKNGNKLEVIVTCGVKKNSEYLTRNIQNSRMVIHLDDKVVFRLEDLNKVLLEDYSREWIYSKRAEYFEKQYMGKHKNDFVHEDTSYSKEPVIYRKTSNNRRNTYDRSNGVLSEIKKKYQDRGIEESLPRGYCPYCTNELKIFKSFDLEVLRCNICSFKAEVIRSNNTIKFHTRIGGSRCIVKPIPEKFK